MKLLISPTTVDEARLVAEAGCEIVDTIKLNEPDPESFDISLVSVPLSCPFT